MNGTEFECKQGRLHTFLAQHELDALLLQRVSSFAWATCGASGYVNTATTNGPSSLLVTASGRYLITNNIERVRLEQEERLLSQGWELRVAPWHEAQRAVAGLTRGLKLGADGIYPGAVDLSYDLARLRARLEPEEVVRFREVGRLCAEAIDAAVRAVGPGQTEYQIAGLLAQEAQSRGVQAIVNLVATDSRAYTFRHPLPTAKKLERYALLALSGRRHGLVCSVTRLVHFGRLPEELRRKAEAVARVDAAMIASTRPGRTLGDVIQRAIGAYAEVGFADEWHLHHQGGAAAYESREYLATPGSIDAISAGQAYAWNPSIAGTKSEDTMLVSDAGQEILTAVPGWPVLQVSVDGQAIARPAILEIP